VFLAGEIKLRLDGGEGRAWEKIVIVENITHVEYVLFICGNLTACTWIDIL
jgi:hypothetical protein